MNLKESFDKIRCAIARYYYHWLDQQYIPLDRKYIRRTKNIRLIPFESGRRGGKYAYAEWAHVIGIFQTLIYLHLDKYEGNKILEIGCGTGLLAIACEPFIKGGKYIGIDIMKDDINFCSDHYSSVDFEFLHINTRNPFYAPRQAEMHARWPIESESVDLVLALSVWTHLGEEDAVFYFSELSRVLKQNGKAIVTFFLLDETYRHGLESRKDQEGAFHATKQTRWIFNSSAHGSRMWFSPEWTRIPESAIGVTEAGLAHLIDSTGLKIIEHYQGNWKEIPGAYFQDVLVFEK